MYGDWLDLNIVIIDIQKTSRIIRDKFHEDKLYFNILWFKYRILQIIIKYSKSDNYFNYQEIKPILKYYPIQEKIFLTPKTIKTKKTKIKLSMEAESDKKLLKDDGTLYTIGYYKLSDLVDMCSEYNIDVHNICTDGQNLKTKTKKELYTSIKDKISN